MFVMPLNVHFRNGFIELREYPSRMKVGSTVQLPRILTKCYSLQVNEGIGYIIGHL